MEKKTILVVLLVAIIVFIGILNINFQKEKKPTIILDDKLLEERLSSFEANIRSGGPPKDGIPPIENPKYISMQEADEMLDDNDVVFIVESEDGIYIYPQKILVWHEIVNEEFDGEKVSITYCPLTGSAIGFKGSLSVRETTFGTSGKLLNSNLVMYDRVTESYWPQILGIAIKGELKGERLDEFPVIWTRWNLAKSYYNEANVLSENTGFIRNYDRDPYGSYLQQNNYYDSGKPLFPVMYADKRFQDKEVVIAGRLNEIPFAILKSSIREKRILEFEIKGEKLKAIYNESLDTVKVFDSSGSHINSFDVMWFAWYAFEPETEVFE